MNKSVATLTLPENMRAILAAAVIDEQGVTLVGQLPRKDYESVNKFLLVAGAVWNRKAKRHLFSSPAAGDKLRGLLAEGSILNEQKYYQAFYTPVPLAARMAALANIEPGQAVLEPSAGTGRLCSAVLTSQPRAKLTMFEIRPELSLALHERFPGTVIEGDFLECRLTGFDRVVMNPPFDNGADIAHIRHALGTLKRGGTLVGLCSNGPRQIEALRPLARTWEALDPETFHESGAGVHAALLVIGKGE